VEREPHALWQRDGEVFVIAQDGTVIDVMQDARFANLPLVVGEDANRRTGDYLALLDAAGPLRGRVVAGTLVSGRRWTLKIDNGVDVRLPEIGASDAMARLAKLDREQKVLDKDVIAIDLRISDRVVVRLTEEAMAARLDTVKKKPARGKGVET
jgi:cell division protein FtsQ